ncbi:hypothetical protein H4219_003776 [Mycoemilia scoparia]|uniref:Pru domain-containing protein n=1 Tax=Mycoemilia scoparia TaxID=417184 RepID=A0A9W7ZTT9_9FUNG|nr:hypothetical protein H4219_003776 [Mycoemilia scoparia]
MSNIVIPDSLKAMTKAYVSEFKLPSSTLLACKAGRCQRREGTKVVEPIQEKGLLYLNVEDDLRKLTFVDRQTKAVVDEKYLFEGDSKFLNLNEPSNQVWGFRFESSGEHVFFWLQEWDVEKQEKPDYEPYKKIFKEYVNGDIPEEYYDDTEMVVEMEGDEVEEIEAEKKNTNIGSSGNQN